MSIVYRGINGADAPDTVADHSVGRISTLYQEEIAEEEEDGMGGMCG